MRTRLLLLAVPALCLSSCFQGDNATPNDAANDAQGTGSPYLAREVTGAWLLSQDQRFGYDEACNIVKEGFIQEAFDIEGEMTTIDVSNGCEFRWPEGTVGVGFGSSRPFASIYHAEYNFDKLYQPNQKNLTTGQMGRKNEKPSYHGPQPQGTGAELPPELIAGPRRDTSAANDTATTTSRIPPRAAEFTEAPQNTATMQAVTGVGDKALWEPAKNTLHVLYNNHILNIKVQTKAKPAERQQKAIQMAGVMLSHFNEDDAI